MATERCNVCFVGVAKFTCHVCKKKLCDRCAHNHYIPYAVHVCNDCKSKTS